MLGAAGHGWDLPALQRAADAHAHAFMQQQQRASHHAAAAAAASAQGQVKHPRLPWSNQPRPVRLLTTELWVDNIKMAIG
jgi:hypothetical protein